MVAEEELEDVEGATEVVVLLEVEVLVGVIGVVEVALEVFDCCQTKRHNPFLQA